MAMHEDWIDDWNDIIVDVFFSDEEFRALMKIPEDTDVIDFIDRYFIRSGTSSVLLTNESVRIIYGISYSEPNDNPNVSINTMSFDIYVKTTDLHNYNRNRLTFRTHLIARKIVNLLTSKRYHGVYRFFHPRERDAKTTTPGYVRYSLDLDYQKTY